LFRAYVQAGFAYRRGAAVCQKTSAAGIVL
jgi:hypothetical protein